MLSHIAAVARMHGLRLAIPAINHLLIRQARAFSITQRQHSNGANALEKSSGDSTKPTASGYQLSQPVDASNAQKAHVSSSWLSDYRLEQPVVVTKAPSVKKLDLEVHLKSEQFDYSVTHNTEDFDSEIARHREVLDEQLLQGSDAHDAYFKRSSERYDAHVAKRSAVLDARDSE
jgi:hypothetical protein